MAIKNHIKRTWTFSYEQDGVERMLGEYDCIRPESTKMGKELESMLGKDGVTRINYSIKKTQE